MATWFDGKLVFKKDINPFIIVGEDWDSRYILGILNSRLISYLYVTTSSIATKDDFRQTTLAELRRLPMRKLDRSNTLENEHHKRMVQMVESMLQLHKNLSRVKTDQERTALQRQIDATDKQIDALVYELYGLTEDEIGIIEGSSN